MGLHQTLAEHAKVQRSPPKKDVITYAHQDSQKIYNFIYGEWEFIKSHGLYLPSKRNAFMIDI